MKCRLAADNFIKQMSEPPKPLSMLLFDQSFRLGVLTTECTANIRWVLLLTSEE